MGQFVRFADHFRHVEQGFGGDAAANRQVPPSGEFGLDDGNLQSKVGGEERGCIPAWSASQHYHLRVNCHKPITSKAVTTPNI